MSETVQSYLGLIPGVFSKFLWFKRGSWYFHFCFLIVFKRERGYYKQWCLYNKIRGYLRWYCQLKIGSRCLCWITNWLRSGEKGWKELKLGLDELKSRPWAYHEIWSHHQHVTPSIESQYFTVCNFFKSYLIIERCLIQWFCREIYNFESHWRFENWQNSKVKIEPSSNV